MRTTYLLPNKFKKIGWLIFIPIAIISIYWLIFEPEPNFLTFNVFSFFNSEVFNPVEHFSIIKNNILDEILSISLIISSIFIAFSKEKNEDEYISIIRLNSLVWATYMNYAILIFAIIFVYGMSFLWIFIFNMFTILFLFIIKFNWEIYKIKKEN